jgi:hypothetical protein
MVSTMRKIVVFSQIPGNNHKIKGNNHKKKETENPGQILG